MKAFKQINLNFENRIVFSYATILCFLCSFIILNPLFGQEKEDQNSNKPEVKIDVQKEFDEQGNVIAYDSSYSWYWSGKEISSLNLDSIFESFHEDFDHWGKSFKRNHIEPFSHFHHPGWQWNDIDSSLYSSLDQIFDEDFEEYFNFKYEHFPFHDSTIASFFDFEGFDQKFRENQKDYLDRLKKYHEEHQQLIEKYFGQPFKENDQDIKYDQNKYSPKNEKVESNKSGRI
ncbi:MAG: hypothetical protein K8R74_17810 [Bacteroidales bacterium]|nr:hypothetical protein [Bacteroidales bacterium]